MSGNIRGLTMFISSIRTCKTPDQEQKRVFKELAKIRSAFSKKRVDGYSKKKYLWKIMYIYMLGYTPNFGHMEAVNLLTSTKFSEKQVGYVALSVLLIEHSDLLRLCIQSVRNDLNGVNEVFQCLALTAIANVGEQEMAEALAGDVQKLLLTTHSRNFVKKKAALCLLRLFRKFPEIIQAESWAPRLIEQLEYANVGVLMCVMSLLMGIVKKDSKGYEAVVKQVIKLLHKFVVVRECPKDYTYYRTPCPWLVVKLLRILQYFPPPTDASHTAALQEILTHIVTKTEVTKSVNKNNSEHSILFEAFNLIIHLNLNGAHTLHKHAVVRLSQFISVREPNIRYLGLEAMSRLAKIPGTLDNIKRHLSTIQFSMKDHDISIRKRALDLSYAMSDESNANVIIADLCEFLTSADYSMREDLVLKTAILAEKYAPSKKFYVDVILKLITLAGDFVTEDIWHRVVQIVTNHEETQEYAVKTVYNAMKQDYVHENTVRIGGYLLGEFGHLISERVSAEDQFEVLTTHFAESSTSTKALLLSTFMKMANMNQDLSELAIKSFKKYRSDADVEIQQRATEYYEMARHDDQELMDMVWEAMPDFPERESAVEAKEKNKPSKTPGGDETKKEEESDSDSEWSEGDKSGDESGDRSGSGSDEESDEEPDRRNGNYETQRFDYNERSNGDAGPDVHSSDEESGSASGSGSGSESGSEEDDDAFSNSSDSRGKSGGGDEPPDLLAFDDVPVGNKFKAGAAHASSQPEQDPAKLVAALHRKSGILFESDLLQIGLKMKNDNGHTLLFIMYYGNRSVNEDLLNFQCTIVNSDGLNIQMKPDGPMTVEQTKQKPQHLMIHCLQPFSSYPEIKLDYELSGKSQSFRLKLPILASKFITPWTCSGMPEFVAKYKSLDESNEERFTFKARDPIDVDKLRSQLETIGCHVSQMPNSPTTVVASWNFHTASRGDDGTPLVYISMLRLETNAKAQMLRATLRTESHDVTDAFKFTLQQIFGQPPEN